MQDCMAFGSRQGLCGLWAASAPTCSATGQAVPGEACGRCRHPAWWLYWYAVPILPAQGAPSLRTAGAQNPDIACQRQP